MTTVTIGDLCDAGQASIQTGPFGSQLHAHEYSSEGVPVVPTEAIRDGVILHEAVNRIPPQVAARLERHLLRQGDILFARRGVQATGHSARVREAETGWICGTGAIRLRLSPSCRTVEGRWLAHLLAGTDAVRWFKQHAIGATMPNLNEGIIRAFPLRLPPIGEQRSAADLLDALHDKIALNARMNATLEAMARAVFEDWFVRFGPVRAKAEGRAPPGLAPDLAALFPDRLTETPDGEVPEGWRRGTLGDVAVNRADICQPDDLPPETPYIGLEHMPRRSIALDSWGKAGDAGSAKLRFRRGEYLFGKLRPYFHKVGIAAVDGVCTTDAVVVRTRQSASASLVLMIISSADFVAYTDRSSTGTKMPRTRWQDMARYRCAIPSPSLAQAFSDVAAPMTDRIVANIHETRTLTALRDLLLPRLISGQLRLRDAERAVEAAL